MLESYIIFIDFFFAVAGPFITTVAPITTTTTVQQRLVTCKNPDLPLNSIEITENEFKVGDSIIIKCQVGFELIGTKTRTCLDTGLFSISNALCAPG